MSAEIVNLSDMFKQPDYVFAYSPADIVLSHPVGGCDIRFCPKSEDWGHGLGITRINGLAWYNKVGRDGTLVIKAGGADKMTAAQVLAFLVGEDGRSERLGRSGVRPISGDPAKDELIKAEADRAWAEHEYFNARNKVRAHEAAVDKARVAGTEVPGYTKALDEAYRKKAAYEKGGYSAVSTHPCPVCNAPAYSQKEQDIHMEAIHNKKQEAAAAVVQAAAPAADVNALVAQFMEHNKQLAEQNTKLAERLAKLEAVPKRGRPPKNPVVVEQAAE